jgi:hypothetical protein
MINCFLYIKAILRALLHGRLSCAHSFFCMRLHLLKKTPHIAIYYDTQNDWLFLDWIGELTLTDVQNTCLEVSRCFLHRAYPRVLNSNLQVTNVSWSAVGWLTLDFMPQLAPAGVERIAWICSPSLWGRSVVQRIVGLVPQVSISLFDEVEAAADWLQHTRLEYAKGYLLPQRAISDQAKLVQQVEALKQKVASQRPEAESGNIRRQRHR